MSPRVWGDFPSAFPNAEHQYIDYSACNMIEDFRSTVYDAAASGGGPDTIIGWSMGAMLAVEALAEALMRGEGRVRRFAIFGGTLRFTDRDREKGCPPRVLEAMISSLEKDASGTLDNFRAAMFRGNRMPEAERTDFTADGLMSGLKYLKIADARESWARLAAHPEAPRIVWIHGTDDAICPPGCAPAGAFVLPGCGHAPFADAPQSCSTLLEKYFAYDE